MESARDCHHLALPFELMGFAYFLLFEYIFRGICYDTAPKRHKLAQRKAPIQFFTEIAEMEYQDLFGDDCGTMEEDRVAMWR